MAISSLRPSYAPHAKVALRLLAGARSQASITSGDVSTLSHSRTAGGQQESPLNDFAEPQSRSDDQPEDRSGAGDDRGGSRHAAGPKNQPDRDAAANVTEGESPAGLVTMAQLGPEERMRAAEEAYGYSRHILGQDSHVRLGDSYDAAS